MWIEIAARNLRKNWRRSLFSIFAICISFTAVNIFGCFTAYIFENLRETFIYAGGNGHVTVFKKGFLDEGRIDPVNYLLDETIQSSLQQQLDKLPGIAVVGRQLQIRGLISNGEVSTIFIARGLLFSAYDAMRERARGVVSIKNYQGKRLLDSNVYEIGLSEGLSKALNLTLGTDGMVTSPTVDGFVNALDFKVAQVFTGAPEALDDKLLIVPLSFAQSLYDTRSVERINILLDESTGAPVVELKKAAPTPTDDRPLALVVDDSITVRRVTERFLHRNGMRVLTAKDGLDAISVMQDNKPDIILLDIEMPRMDGYEFASHVRNDDRVSDVPIIMITSRVGDKHRARAIELGVNDYLGKPYQDAQLLEAIQRQFEEKGIVLK